MAAPIERPNYKKYGILNNSQFLSQYIAENPLTATLKFANINRWPIKEPYDHPNLIGLCSIYVEARYHVNATVNMNLKKAMIAGETLSPKIPMSKYDDQDNCRNSIIAWMKQGLRDNIFDVLGDFTNITYQNYRGYEDVIGNFQVNNMPDTYPWTIEQIDNLTIDSCVFLMYYFSFNLRTSLRISAIENLTLAYCALSKRGIVTDEFCTKIQNSVRDELGVNIVLNQGVINALYKGYLINVNEVNASEVFVHLNSLIPDIALRLKLTLNQAAGSGLTLYTIIGRAIRMYHGFPWGRVNTLTGGELQNWKSAQGLIKDNAYFGFRRDMGAARSTLYKTVGYVARELLVRINGERTLMRYAGLAGNIKNKNAIDLLIATYVEKYTVIEGDETEEERATIPALSTLQENVLFA